MRATDEREMRESQSARERESERERERERERAAVLPLKDILLCVTCKPI